MVKKILVIGPAWVGDMVMAQCLFKLLKVQHPETMIDVLAPAWSLPLLERMPEVNKGIVMPLGHGQLGLKTRYRIGKSLRAERYDQAIVLPNSFKSALIPFWARIPLRTGWRREVRQLILNDIRTLDQQKYPLMIERFMALGLKRDDVLLKPYPLPELQSPTEAQQDVIKKYQLNCTKPILVLCPGAEFGPAKRWPEKYYSDIANAKLIEDWSVWIMGSAKDMPVAEAIMEATHHRCVNLAGKTKLVEAVDLLSLATIVVSNDSGLMHIAAAVRKPLIAIYGPTSPSFTPPLHDKAKLLQLDLECQPCFKRECPLQHNLCMKELKPQMVLTAMRELI